MQKIDKLSDEQMALLPVYRDKWIKIGLNCDPCDFEKAKDAASRAYREAGLDPPAEFIHALSPVHASKLAAEIFGESDWKKLNEDQVYGSHDAGWLCFYDYFLEVVELDVCKRLKPLIDLAQVCGWWAPYRNVCILQDRHSELHRDDDRRLHNPSGPAVLYRDGFGVYAWHGVRVPKFVIEEPDSITASRIDQESNSEIRRIMVDRYDEIRYRGAYLKDSGAEIVHQDDWGTVWRKTQEGDEDLVMVELVNSSPEPDGSYKHYFQRIHPECRPLPTPFNGGKLGEPQELTGINACASVAGMTGTEYKRNLVAQS